MCSVYGKTRILCAFLRFFSILSFRSVIHILFCIIVHNLNTVRSCRSHNSSCVYSGSEPTKCIMELWLVYVYHSHIYACMYNRFEWYIYIHLLCIHALHRLQWQWHIMHWNMVIFVFMARARERSRVNTHFRTPKRKIKSKSKNALTHTPVAIWQL